MCWRKGTSVKANLAERGGVWEGSAVVSSIGTLFLELWVSGGGRGGGVERGSRGPSGRDRRQRQSCWAPLDPPGGVRLLLLHVHRAILSHAAVSPLIQPLAPPPPPHPFHFPGCPQLCSHLSGLWIQPLSTGLFIRVRAEGPGLLLGRPDS